MVVSERIWAFIFGLAILIGIGGIYYNGPDVLDYFDIVSGAVGLAVLIWKGRDGRD